MPVRVRGSSRPVRRACRHRLAGVLLALWPWSLFAQQVADNPAPQTPPSSPSKAAAKATQPPKRVVTLGEVVVSANRRREPSREVPMHVDVVPAEQLQQIGAKTMNDYVSYQPGVFLASQGGTGQGMLVMRGVSTGNQTSPTVSVYIDDVPVGGSTVYAAAATFLIDPVLLDLDHIEFLYGPQGTLYGAGSMGGLLKYVTRQPDASGVSGNVGTDLSSTEHGGFNYSVRGTLNVPLVKDVAALRLSVIDDHTAGVYNAVGKVTADGIDRTHTQGVRAQIQVDPTDKLSFNLSALAQRIAADGLSMADYNLQGQPISGGPYNRSLNHREPFTQELQLYSFRAAYDFGWSTLDWISAYQVFTNYSVQDYPDGFLNLLNELGSSFGVDQTLQNLYVDSVINVHKSTQEIRLTSPKGETFDWLGGLWLNREDAWEDYALVGDNLNVPGRTYLIQQHTSSRFEEYAGYGDITWHITPEWDLAAGARISGDSQRLASQEEGAAAGRPGGFSISTSSSDTTGMITGTWKPNTTNSFYARVSTGYRPGGLQAPLLSSVVGPVPAGATDTFGSDKLQSYEIGYKGSHLDGHLNVGVSAYDIEWHNMQLITFALGNQVIENAGDARVGGVEAQLGYDTGPWNFHLAGAYTDARTLQSNPEIGIREGAPLPYSAKITGTLSTRYQFQLGGYGAYVAATERASTVRHAGFEGNDSDPDFRLPGFGLLDLNGGVALDHGITVDLYVRNALNRRVAMGTLNAQAINFLATLGGPMLVQQSTPRTIGVSFNMPFR
ncbi:TonB-dependent receptor [Dyella solisilvae]|uniref:TonB-dependent receptor n=1 Tax=Dyella solisilvae TaxID=1920168 RepID=A0A370KCY6_9GAMM|nr:TonB-dependent receptor [Dyella solisilvae]RDJ00298.1 TonB-dependent receptor [Dyella solisilvae]